MTDGGRVGHPATALMTRAATLEDVFVPLTGGGCAMTDGGRVGHPLTALTLARIRLMMREP